MKLKIPNERGFSSAKDEIYLLESDGIIEVQAKSIPFIYTEVLD